jgi:hypothetical protein
MEIIAGVFHSSDVAQAVVDRLRRDGLVTDKVTVLMPGTSPREAERRVPAEAGESPGMGAALGSVVGGAVGLATAGLVLPGVGPIVVAGMLAAAAAGATGGGVLGDRVEEKLTAGIPESELMRYGSALRRGHSVVIAGAEDGDRADAIRDAFHAGGAETVDAARGGWLNTPQDPVGPH